MAGKVYLVGAGPGDPGLITVKGMEVIRNADVVVYDRLVDPVLLSEAGTGCKLIHVGKTPGGEGRGQKEINDILVDLALEGKRVVRLKGGDPFVFGRGGEEAEQLVEAGIEFEIVPGVSSAIAAPAYAGIPLTHRQHASSFICLTGHEDPMKTIQSIRWNELTDRAQTLVILMGVGNLSHIVDKLLDAGADAGTPAAIIEDGTTHRQRTVNAPLGELVEQAENARIRPPAVIVIGDVVLLGERLRWFAPSPLVGKTILVTRPKAQADAFARLLTDAGAVPDVVPIIAVEGLDDTSEIEEEVRRLDRYDWVLFTSVNGVHAFLERMEACGVSPEVLSRSSIGAIGPVTAKELESRGVTVSVVPEVFTSNGLLAVLRERSLKEKKVLVPRATGANPALARELTLMGAEVRDLPVYRTVERDFDGERLISMLESGGLHTITFMSPSAVKTFLKGIGDRGSELLAGGAATIACIGPVTAAAVRELGMEPDVVATTSTMEGLVAALEDHLRVTSSEDGGERAP
ncbi:MAG: uroporphyrinogen-III C-methyltransferase [Methanopyri archaeon]|jgi:uroporphyrinogen III methyltransferase/synthase|nr:uroporphyrinogen-III C-methyltransferase [Methanopyri archaeon]